MKTKSKLNIVLMISMACLCILSAFLPAVSARDSFAPSWLKEGTYVKYVTDKESSASIFNITDAQFSGLNWLTTNASYDTIKYWKASFNWRCISINDTTAKIQVTFDYVGDKLYHFIGTDMNTISLNNETLQLTGEAYVDLYTRAVYTTKGTLLGTTHLWLPTNPSEGQDMIIWDVPSEKATLQAKLDNVWLETIQGKQDGFQVGGTITVNGESQNIMMTYDLDTGLGIDGYFQWDPIMAAIGISNGNLEKFSDTNIDLGTQDTSLNLVLILQYALLPIAILLVIGVFVIRHMRKRK